MDAECIKHPCALSIGSAHPRCENGDAQDTEHGTLIMARIHRAVEFTFAAKVLSIPPKLANRGGRKDGR
jgi:hypothetical protein